jgi:hypothetical protein
MPAHITVSVSGISLSAREADLKRYFEKRLPGCEPMIGDLCNDFDNATQVTTVTFRRKSKAACRRAVRKLEEDDVDMRDSVGFSSTLGFSSSFLHLTLLDNKAPRPKFE